MTAQDCSNAARALQVDATFWAHRSTRPRRDPETRELEAAAAAAAYDVMAEYLLLGAALWRAEVRA
jgi:hypothetical protein